MFSNVFLELEGLTEMDRGDIKKYLTNAMGVQPTNENDVEVPLLCQVVDHSGAGSWGRQGPRQKAGG